MEVTQREFVAIVGPSGCGKTSLLRALCGLIRDEHENAFLSGEIRVEGLTPREACSKRRFGFVFQNPVLLPWRTAAENIELPIELGSPISSTSSEDLLAMLGLADFAHAYPDELSGGMKQRINLARALVHNPKILLMDEPFGALDEITRERLNIELRSIHQRLGTTTLFITHSLREAAFLADRIIFMSSRPSTIAKTMRSPFGSERNQALWMTSTFNEYLEKVQQAFGEAS